MALWNLVRLTPDEIVVTRDDGTVALALPDIAQGTRLAIAACPPNTILLGYRGSYAHGVHLPETIDDLDLMGICTMPVEYYLGLHRAERSIEKTIDGWVDLVIYELQRIVKLLLGGNPNVLSLLWLEPDDYVVRTPPGDRLIQARDAFSSRRAYQPFRGYALAQLKKMTTASYEGYAGNTRRALYVQFGYDTKYAGHLIRLLRMGTEFLRAGRLIVRRPDAEELLAIKRGEWGRARVEAVAGELLGEMERAYLTSPLPDEPDTERVEALVIDMLRDALNLGANPTMTS